MFARIITTIIILLGLTTGGYSLIKYQASKNAETTTPQVAALTDAWIEVEQGTVFLRSVGQGTPIKSGDTVHEGDTLETSKNTSAIIHFPDGSLLRVDKETSFTVAHSSYTPKDKTLVVEIALLSGRLWSKVVGLATPTSRWEVKTSNTVATVRGTAFGMGFKNNKSWILGSEHTVAVTPLDPVSKTPLQNAMVSLSEKAFIEIGEKEIALAKATTSPILTTRISTSSNLVTEDVWVKKVQSDDEEFNKKVEALKQNTNTKDGEAWRGELEKEVADTLYRIAPVKKEQVKEEAEKIKKIDQRQNDTPKDTSSTQLPSKNSETTPPKTISIKNDQKPVVLNENAPIELKSLKTEIGATQIDSSLVVSLIKKSGGAPQLIGADNYPINFVPLKEGDQLIIQVGIKANDFTENIVDVVPSTTFTILGGIGSVNKDGIFTAKLSDEVSENGASYGAIVATYKDPKSGKTFINRTNLIRVEIIQGTTPPTDIGGQ